MTDFKSFGERPLLERLEVIASTTLHATSEDSHRARERDAVREAIAEMKKAMASAGASPKHWLATYGDLGLQVYFFSDQKTCEDAVLEAAHEHSNGRLDSYTYEDVA